MVRAKIEQSIAQRQIVGNLKKDNISEKETPQTTNTQTDLILHHGLKK